MKGWRRARRGRGKSPKTAAVRLIDRNQMSRIVGQKGRRPLKPNRKYCLQTKKNKNKVKLIRNKAANFKQKVSKVLKAENIKKAVDIINQCSVILETD